MAVSFDDFYALDGDLPPTEQLVAETVRRFVDDKVMPVIAELRVPRSLTNNAPSPARSLASSLFGSWAPAEWQNEQSVS